MKKSFLLWMALAAVGGVKAQKVEFYTPSIVHVVREKAHSTATSEVVTAVPQKVKVT